MKRILLLFIVLSFYTKGICQSVPDEESLFNDIGSQFNNVGSLKINSDILRKDYFTGRGDISIPFYKYKMDGIDLSVTMSYNTGGLLVNDYASNIGLGWKLNTGGYIFRQGRGKVDEKHYWFGVPMDYWDDESDIFYLNFNNRFYKVFFSMESNEYITVPKSNIKIERYCGFSLITSWSWTTVPPWNSSLGNDLKFVVTDESGNKFYYSKGRWETVSGTSEPIYWLLDKVVSCNGKVTNYVYEEFNNILTTGHYFAFDIHTHADHTTYYDWNGHLPGLPSGSGYFATADGNIEKAVTTKRIKNIFYPNGITVNFNYSASDRCDAPGDKALIQIDISETGMSTGPAAKWFSYFFNQAYFISPPKTNPLTSYDWTTVSSEAGSCPTTALSAGTNHMQYRLKLKSVDLVGYDRSTIKKYYSFEYNNVPLTERVGGGKDCFGYSNTSTPATFAYCTSDPGAYITNFDAYFVRETLGPMGMDPTPSTTTSVVGGSILTKIINEYGGSIAFSYKPISTIGLGGGIILDEILYHDGYSIENDTKEKLTYGAVEKFIPAEGSPRKNFFSHDEYCWGSPYGAPEVLYTRLSNNYDIINTALNTYRGAILSVTSSITDHLGNLVNKEEYNFSGLSNTGSIYSDHGLSSNAYNPTFSDPPPFNKPFGYPLAGNKQFYADWGIGLLYKKSSYDNNNNLIQTEDYTYDVNIDYISSSQFKNRHLSHNGHFVPYYADTYYPFTGITFLKKKTTKNYYTNTNYIENSYNYTYDYKNNLVATSFNNSLGETVLETYRYNYHYTSSITPAIDQLNANGIQRLLWIEKHKNIGVGSANNLLKLNLGTPYITPRNPSIVGSKYVYSLATSIPITPTVYSTLINLPSMSTGASTSNFHLDNAITEHDDAGNPIEVSDLAGNGGNTYSATILNNHTGDVLAQAKNAKYTEISYSGFETNVLFWPSPFIKGNCDYEGWHATTAHAMLGRASYYLHSGTFCRAINAYSTPSAYILGKNYTVSVWVLSLGLLGGSVAAYNGMSSIPLTLSGTYTVPATSEVWNLYKGNFNASADGVELYGTAYIDEFKVYPSDCIMTTSNFLPLIGKTSDVDANDNITTYEYDAFGNLFVTRDHYGNVISKTNTVIQGH